MKNILKILHYIFGTGGLIVTILLMFGKIHFIYSLLQALLIYTSFLFWLLHSDMIKNDSLNIKNMCKEERNKILFRQGDDDKRKLNIFSLFAFPLIILSMYLAWK